MNLGYILRRVRNIRKLSLSGLSEITGLSKSSLSNIENGINNPTIDTLEKICLALNVSTTDVIKLSKDFDYAAKVGKELELYDIDIDDMIEKHIVENKNYYQSRLLIGTDSNNSFNTAEEAMQFILSQPSVMGYGGFDTSKMTDEDKIAFANDLLEQIEFLGYKYSKKNKK